ncbi:hypothetical protein [Streptomyces sp. SID5789]|uniref:hypothetical protein n=1 Tax=Streptomyces sp. SID5789 TaxID=2690310 RepID=UPI00136851BD|nr:hypothetical protein [Streptomyces sp. SID5789]MZE75203.1 hypothetical protein [Streptomyces sp. SID5789]
MTFNTLAASWTEVTSAVAAPLAVAATLLAGWWAWRAVVPHRKAIYKVEITPMLSSSHSGLAVTLGSDRLSHPHVATLFLTNTGNREIDVASFNSEPIDFDMNCRIVSVLASTSNQNRRVPPAAINGNALRVDPYVIHKGQSVAYKLLLDGANPRLDYRHNLSASLKEAKPAPNEQRLYILGSLGVLVVSVAMTMWAVRITENTSEDLKRFGKELEEVAEAQYQRGKRDQWQEERRREKAGEAAPPAPSAPASAGSPTPSASQTERR